MQSEIVSYMKMERNENASHHLNWFGWVQSIIVSYMLKIVRNENALHPSESKAEKKNEFYTNVGININKFIAPSLHR